jgi:hypothetical protein
LVAVPNARSEDCHFIMFREQSDNLFKEIGINRKRVVVKAYSVGGSALGKTFVSPATRSKSVRRR